MKRKAYVGIAPIMYSDPLQLQDECYRQQVDYGEIGKCTVRSLDISDYYSYLKWTCVDKQTYFDNYKGSKNIYDEHTRFAKLGYFDGDVELKCSKLRSKL